MARVKRGVTAHRRHKKVLHLTRGFRGTHSKLFRPANETLMKSLWYAYAHRRKRKGDFRRLWIARINAAARQSGMSYSRFINGLKRGGVAVNRKLLAELAVHDSQAFGQLVTKARSILGS